MRAKKVAIEIGHGPKANGTCDPGALGPDGITEYALNVLISRTLQRALVDTPWPSEVLFDPFVIDEPLPLHLLGRLGSASDIFVSIHLNACNKLAQGHEVLVHSLGSQPSSLLAECVNTALQERLRIPDRGVKERKDLTILAAVNARVPAVLVESFFVDAARSKAEAFDLAAKAAEAIAWGIYEYVEHELDRQNC